MKGMNDTQEGNSPNILGRGTFGENFNKLTFRNFNGESASKHFLKKRKQGLLSRKQDSKRIKLNIHAQETRECKQDRSDLDGKNQETKDTPLDCAVREWIQLSEDITARIFNNWGCHLAGNGLLGRAVVTWHLAAGAGNAPSHFNLAVCYQRGLGVDRNSEKALTHYREAARLGHSGALYNLSVLTHQGALGLVPDPGGATCLLQRAASTGLPQAIRELGVVYANAIPRAMSVAVDLFQEASLGLDPGAGYFLGLCYEYGLGVGQDVERAVLLYGRAAGRGHGQASRRLQHTHAAPGTAGKDDLLEYSLSLSDYTTERKDGIKVTDYGDTMRTEQDRYLSVITEVLVEPWTCLSKIRCYEPHIPNPKDCWNSSSQNHYTHGYPSNSIHHKGDESQSDCNKNISDHSKIENSDFRRPGYQYENLNSVSGNHYSPSAPSISPYYPGPRLLRLPAHFNYGIVEDFDASMFQHYGICDKQKTIDELRMDCPVSSVSQRETSAGLDIQGFNLFRCNFAILEDGLS